MNCEESRQLLHAYLDDQLDLATALNLEEHVAGCPGCQAALDAASTVSGAVKHTAPYYPAPAVLREKIQRAIRAETGEIPPRQKIGLLPPWWARPMAVSGLAAALVLSIGVAVFLALRHADPGPLAELVDSHVRSLQENHLYDVESTDQHTVKPWFAGKLDFSPPVIDLASEGFPLVGGRLDYLNQRKVAALIYRRNKHIINLFIWPGGESPGSDSRQGFNLIRFECKGMACWAVSDLNAAELRQFADLFAAQKPASTRN